MSKAARSLPSPHLSTVSPRRARWLPRAQSQALLASFLCFACGGRAESNDAEPAATTSIEADGHDDSSSGAGGTGNVDPEPGSTSAEPSQSSGGTASEDPTEPDEPIDPNSPDPDEPVEPDPPTVPSEPTPRCVIHVALGGDDRNDGESWAQPLRNVQTGITVARNECEVWVAEGTYTPGTAEGDAFELEPGVSLYGGFQGDETDRSARRGEATVFDGQGINENLLYGVSDESIDGITFRNAGGSALVNVGVSPIIQGCHFEDNGETIFAGDWVQGGAISNLTRSTEAGPIVSSPQVLHSTFIRNRAASGGALYFEDAAADALVEDCVFSENEASSTGGGAIRTHGFVTIRESEFDSNRSTNGRGGAIYAADVLVEGGSFTNNSAFAVGAWIGDGGAITTHGGQILDAVFSGNDAEYCGAVAVTDGGQVLGGTFSDNLADGGGGALCLSDASALHGGLFTDNVATRLDGGAIRVRGDSMIDGATFMDNSAGADGGAIETSGDSSQITNSLFIRNQAVRSGGAINVRDSSTVASSTFFNNQSSDHGSTISVDADESPTLVNNVIWGGANHSVAYKDGSSPSPELLATCTDDPLASGASVVFMSVSPFVDVSAATGTLNLRLDPIAGAACIDHGSDALLSVDVSDMDDDGNTTEHIPFDIDGAVRTQGTTVDPGAYETTPQP